MESSFEILKIKLLGTLACSYFCGHIHVTIEYIPEGGISD